MRNLKKFLALVLAMMMTFSLMITANASYTANSDFSDAESLTPEFREAVSVLEGLEVFEGYEDGTFKPKNNITRAEVATIVYRLATGDVKGAQANLYKDYATFTDVKADHWAAGYINYCANAEWIAGYGNGKFGPNDQVTGYQAASMILRAVGYGKNKEFVGSGWQVQTANFSRSLGLLKNVDDTTYANTLNQAAPRELVAEILFQAGLINTVVWNQLTGYRPGNPVQGAAWDGAGLAWENFKLDVGSYQTIDKWGRPGYYWYKNTNTAANRVATISLDPALEFNTAWKECDVAHELGISTNDTFTLFVNSNGYSTDEYMIEATDTVTRVGGQGRITEFYDSDTHPYKNLYGRTRGDWSQSVTMIDTYLAKVTRVTERVLDRQGHVITPAYLYLDVYDGHGVGPADKTGVFFAAGSAAKRNTSEHRLSDDAANWAYAAGDMILVRGYSDASQGESGANTTGLNHYDPVTANTPNQAAIEKEAFENNKLLPAGANFANDSKTTGKGAVALEVVGKATAQKADMKTGKQSVTYWSQDKHTVDGTDYNDAMTLYLDEAGTTTGTTFAWYFDEFNNIIGIDNVPDTINYGVITSIYSAFDQGESATSGTAKAVANVLYANGTTGTITIDKFLMSGTAATTGHGTPDTPMKVAANSLELLPVYDNTNNAALTGSLRNGTAPSNVANIGWLHVAPVINVNAVENGQNNTGNNYFGVLRGNLFKFVASTDGNMTAIEVAGNNANNGIYTGHYNKMTAVNGAKLYKNFGYIDLTNATGTNADVRLDSDARIMVRASADSTAVACYDMTTLPGDVTLYDDGVNRSEVDWVDTDNDGRAEYVYVVGTSVGTKTYGLFYYNGGAAQWNGVDKTGTLTGWLNGDPATLTFIGETSFNAVRDSQAYAGHLFGVELTNGVVTYVYDKDNTARHHWLLWDYGTSGMSASAVSDFTKLWKNITTSAQDFKVGTANGNPYTQYTAAIYKKDVTGTPNPANAYEANLSYDAAAGVVYVDSAPANGKFDAAGEAASAYYLNATSKVYGLGMGVTEDGAILDYLNKSTTNDVTIVYEQTGVRAILEIYVATDPNVTPSTPGDSSSATLSLTSAPGVSPITIGLTYANNSGVAMASVSAKVWYRLAGTNNAWISLGTINGTSSAINDGATETSWSAVPSFTGAGATYYEVYTEVTAKTAANVSYTYTDTLTVLG